MSTSPSERATFAADYFDGRTARAHKVTLSVEGDTLAMAGEGLQRRVPISSLRVSEAMGAAPRIIAFVDGGHCQVAAAAMPAVFAKSRVARLQESWRAALLSVAIAVAAVAAAYTWGLPAAAAWAAGRLPESAQAQIGSGTLQFLDNRVLGPSALPEARQAELRARFAAMTVPGGAKPAYRILFRAGGPIRANALTLPDGTIVVTDELVALADNDEEVIAVLGHELGHLGRRHSLRMLIQGSIVAFAVGWYLGDLGGIIAAVPAIFLQLRYSRGFEEEADRFAAEMLRTNGIAPSRLGDILGKLDASMRRGRDPNAADYLGTHPATAERIRALQGL